MLSSLLSLYKYNNIKLMYNTTVLNYDQTCFTHRIIYQNFFFREYVTELQGMPYTVKYSKTKKFQHSTIPAILLLFLRCH